MVKRRAEMADWFTPAPLPLAELNDAQRPACLRLTRSENVGPTTFRELINHYGGDQAAIDVLAHLSRKIRRGKTVRICPGDKAEAELEATRRHGAASLPAIEPH